MAALRRKTKIETGYNAAYSLFIKRARFVLPVVALIIAGTVFSWSFFDTQKLEPEIHKSGGQEKSKSALVAPNFQSVDEKGRPYSVSAQSAEQDEQNPDLIHLYAPAAQLQIDEEKKISLRALGGAYDQARRYLALKGRITVTTDDGYIIETDTLRADFVKGQAVVETPVTGKGPAGTLHAVGASYDTNDQVLILKGPAKIVINDTSASMLAF